MKKILSIMAIMIVTSMGSLAIAQKEVEEVEMSVEELRVAMVKGNKAALEKLTAEELSYGHSGGHVENKTEFVEKIVSGKSDFVSIDLTNQTIQVSDDAAIVRHDLSATTNDSGKPGSVKLHILTIWQKQDGEWKLLARQAVKAPVKN